MLMDLDDNCVQFILGPQRNSSSTRTGKGPHVNTQVWLVRVIIYHGNHMSGTIKFSSITRSLHYKVKPAASFEGGQEGQLPPKVQAKNNVQCKTTHTRRHILARRLPCHCDVHTVCMHKYVTTQFPQFDASFLMRCRLVMLSFALLVMLYS